MRLWIATIAMVALCGSALQADVTVTSALKVEGAAPGMAGPGATPRMTLRIKGLKARSDVETNGATQTSIIDLSAKQLILLQHGQKTAQVYDSAALAALREKSAATPKIDASSKATGRSRAIKGVECDEYLLAIAMTMAEFSGSASMPPEAAEMMKDVRIVIGGSMWVATSGPGIAEFAAFQKAVAEANLAAAFGGVASAAQSGGIDRLMKVLASTPGLPYLTELQMKVQGSGQMAEMMKKMGAMKITNEVTSVSTAAVADGLFQVPAEYKTVTQ